MPLFFTTKIGGGGEISHTKNVANHAKILFHIYKLYSNITDDSFKGKTITNFMLL